MQIFYRQSVNTKTGLWYPPVKTTDNIRNGGLKTARWENIKESAMSIIEKIPFAINKIERWHKRQGHTVVRSNKVRGLYRTAYLMITKS